MSLLAEAFVVCLGLMQGLQGRFPATFEFVRHQPILRSDPFVAPPGQFCLIPQALLGQWVRPIHGILRLPALRPGLRIEGEFHGRQSLKEGGDDALIDRISGQALTNRRRCLCPEVMAQILMAPCVLHDHLVPTDTAGDNALQEGHALAGHAAPAVGLIGGVVGLQDGRNPVKGLPGEGGRVAVVHDYLPFGLGQSALRAAGAARLRLRARFPVHKGAGVGGIAHDGHHCGGGRCPPDGLAVAGAARQPQALRPQDADDLADRLPRQEHLAHQGQGVLPHHVRLFDHPTLLLTEQAHRQGQR